MDKSNVAEQIGQAWITFRKGQMDAAAKAFEDLASRNSDNVDAHYGLGLVQRAQGNRDGATRSFQTAGNLIEAALANDPSSDRLEILQKMVQQRLAEISTSR